MSDCSNTTMTPHRGDASSPLTIGEDEDTDDDSRDAMMIADGDAAFVVQQPDVTTSLGGATTTTTTFTTSITPRNKRGEENGARTLPPPQQQSTTYPAGTRVYKYFSEQGRGVQGRLLDFHPTTGEALIRYGDGLLEHVTFAELQYIAAAASAIPTKSPPAPQQGTPQRTEPVFQKNQDDDEDELAIGELLSSTTRKRNHARAAVPTRVSSMAATLARPGHDHGVTGLEDTSDEDNDDESDLKARRFKKKHHRVAVPTHASPVAAERSRHDRHDRDVTCLGDDDSSDKEADSRAVARRQSRRVRASNSKKKRFLVKSAQQYQKDFWELDDDEEEDDDDDHSAYGYSAKDTAGASRSKKQFPFYDRMPEALLCSKAKQIAELAKIPVPANRALQKLLFDTGHFRMTLLEHQFLAVRKVAGVPNNYPMHENSLIQSADTATIKESLLNWPVDPVKDRRERGVLIADEMGLGKTIEAIAGMVLRSALAQTRGDAKRPSVIVGPNSSVLKQWRDAFVLNGFPVQLLRPFGVGQDNTAFGSGIILFAPRYALQAEIKSIFDAVSQVKFTQPKPNPEKDLGFCVRSTSVLWPSLSRKGLFGLWLQYLSDKGALRKFNMKNSVKREDENPSDCVTRLAAACLKDLEQSKKAVFETVLFDEAHFLKNRCAYWGIAAVLLGVHSLRSIPMTGTPFCNSTGDLASMTSFINPRIHAAKTPWWENVTSGTRMPGVIIERCRSMTKMFIVRRQKDVVLKNMVPKIVERKFVQQYQAELVSYEPYEAALLGVLNRFALLSRENNPEDSFELKQLFTNMMCKMSCMRAANIHAMLPTGREWTIEFSPSRRHLRRKESRPSTCVCCTQTVRPSVPMLESSPTKAETKKKTHAANFEVKDFENGIDDDEMSDFDDGDDDLVAIPFPLCQSTSGIRHYAHPKCFESMKKEETTCPRCLHHQNVFKIDFPGCTRYCKQTNGGFPGSSKIDSVVWWYESVPNDDKVLIVSFFKGSLDLLEGIFDEKGIPSARFDGDLGPYERDSELERFKEDAACKVLLMTAQSGGVGLNIVQANHVAFLDRWYNPFVHTQAEDRCHRIGQKKDVHITYFDCSATLDEAMYMLNEAKKTNSAILLADGLQVGLASQQLSYEDLSGLFMEALKGYQSFRNQWLSADPNNAQNPIPIAPPQVRRHFKSGEPEMDDDMQLDKGEDSIYEDRERARASSLTNDVVDLTE